MKSKLRSCGLSKKVLSKILEAIASKNEQNIMSAGLILEKFLIIFKSQISG